MGISSYRIDASSNSISIPYGLVLHGLRPTIPVKFNKSDSQSILCLLDSSADFSSFHRQENGNRFY